MNKEEIEALIEMKNNCLNASVYDDEKRLIKANAITRALMLLEENQKLKKTLENKNPLEGIFAQVNDDMLLRNCGAMQSEINEYKTQQKEFIKWLEDGIQKVKNTEFLDERIQSAGLVACNRVLSKYKKIIGE